MNSESAKLRFDELPVLLRGDAKIIDGWIHAGNSHRFILHFVVIVASIPLIKALPKAVARKTMGNFTAVNNA